MRIPFAEMKQVFSEILLGRGLAEADAEITAQTFAENSLEGVITHGANRFAAIVAAVDRGEIDIHARAEVEESLGAFERWNGNFALGNVNASRCMGRAAELAGEFGIGIVAVRNTSHWLRAGSWGLLAADRGCLGICWTNTIPSMVPDGLTVKLAGNNPLVICVPGPEGRHVLFDGAMSQYSFGAVQKAALANRPLEVPGGYDSRGEPTRDASELLATRAMRPMGHWKGTALAVVLDLAASALALGHSTFRLGRAEADGEKRGASQVFIAVDVLRYGADFIHEVTEETLRNIREADGGRGTLHFPGEGRIRAREENLKHGIEVNDTVWGEILGLRK
jgi:3-dehydro-L-gulonate 2-dehydrogenase